MMRQTQKDYGLPSIKIKKLKDKNSDSESLAAWTLDKERESFNQYQNY